MESDKQNSEQQKANAVAKQPRNFKFSRRALITLILILAAIGGAVAAYLIVNNQTVYIENSDIEAPEIDLSASTPGVLEDMYVQAGDTVSTNEVVARVGDELIKTKVAGIITQADATVGQSFATGQTVVGMIDPTQLRVVGHIDENKGLDRIHVGQYVTFTADAFGSQKFYGVVDEVSPEARSGDIVFTISDQRQEQEFDIKVRFDTDLYPQLKDGMSAKIWVSAN